jgi:RimJ/RimL family protein N-acetyltransferase
MGAELTLRPVRDEDFAVINRLTADPEAVGEFSWFGWQDNRVVRSRWEDNRLLGPDRGILVVDNHSELVGFVFWQRGRERTWSHCWHIGIALVPELQGRGHGTQAQRLLARYLFAHTTVHRIWAGTEVDNIAEQRALEKAGFTREGITRATGWRDGAWRNGVIYSLLRTDPAV